MFNIELKNLGIKSKREIYLLAVFVLIFYVRFVVLSDIKKIKSLSSENLIKENELNLKKTEFFSVEALIKDQQRYEEEYAQIQKVLETRKSEIAKINNSLISKEKIAEVSYFLISLVNPQDIEFNLINTGPVIEYDKYNEFPAKIKIKADYFAFLRYVKNLENLPYYFDFKKLKIYSQENNGLVNVEAEIVLYVSK